MFSKPKTMWRIGTAVILLLAVLFISMQTSPAQAADSTWHVKYWENKDLSGDPVAEGEENSIDHDWGNGAPAGVINGPFSARWKKTINFTQGSYRFDATIDDGMRIWVDDNLIMNSWADSQVHSVSTTVNISSGEHVVKVEYYEAGGTAVAKLTITPVSTTITQWRGDYFNNTALSGSPVFTRNDNQIDFNWGTGSPGSGIAADNFSVRWTRDLSLDAGRYRFTTTTDDGVRLWVNNQLIIDKWSSQAATPYSAEIDLSGGSVPIRMEYFESVGGAKAQLSYTQITGTTPAPTPPPATSGTATVNIYRLNMRQGPGTNFPIITTLNRNEVLALAGYRNAAATWIKVVLPNGTQGWLSAVYVISTVPIVNLAVDNNPTPSAPSSPTPAPAGATARVTAFYLNVRQGPAATFPAITVVSLNQVYTLAGVRNDAGTWVKLILSNGTQGWVNASYVATSVPVSSLPVGN